MDAVVLSARIGLALIFAAAALAKLADRAGSRRALVGFGIPRAFAAAIAIGLARGNPPDCHCFGQIH